MRGRLLLAAVAVYAAADALNELLPSAEYAALAAQLVPRAVRVLQGDALAGEGRQEQHYISVREISSVVESKSF